MKKIILLSMIILCIGCAKNKSINNNEQTPIAVIDKKEINLDKLIDNYNEIYSNLTDEDTYINDYGYMCKKYIGNTKTSKLINDTFYEYNNKYIESKNVIIDTENNKNYNVYFCIPNNCKIKILDNYASYTINEYSYIYISEKEYLLKDNKFLEPIFDCDK